MSRITSRGQQQGGRGGPPRLMDCISRVREAALEQGARRGEDFSAMLALAEALDILETATLLTPLLEHDRRRGLAQKASHAFLAIAGIERFTALRDEFGHDFADRVVRQLSGRIQDTIAGATMGRVNRSSVEFSFGADDVASATERLEQLHDALEGEVIVDGQSIFLDITIGFSDRDLGSDSLEALVDRAEHALSKARHDHVRVANFSAQDRVDHQARVGMLSDLRRAIPRQEMSVVYQPKLDLRTGRICGVEALVRWMHPSRGPVSPDQFVTLAEQTNEIRPLTEFVIQRAFADHRLLEQSGRNLSIAVNISGNLLVDRSFTEWALKETTEARDWLAFEITETAIFDNPTLAMEHLNRYHASGLKLAIDDYGSGMSSLAYLKQIPAVELKIDRQFISGLTSSHLDPLLVRSTIDLAHALDMVVTAEGVDNPMALAFLKVMGCDQIQGYQISRPLSLDGLVDFLNDFDATGDDLVPAPGDQQAWRTG